MGRLALTKRRVLTFVMSKYNLLGLGAPVMLTAKLLLRCLYSVGLQCGWDDKLQAGDVVAVEPGLYGEELRAGLRLEENYLITQTGCERLSRYPLDL